MVNGIEKTAINKTEQFIIDYLKPSLRKASGEKFIHEGTNHFTNRLQKL